MQIRSSDQNPQRKKGSSCRNKNRARANTVREVDRAPSYETRRKCRARKPTVADAGDDEALIRNPGSLRCDTRNRGQIAISPNAPPKPEEQCTRLSAVTSASIAEGEKRGEVGEEAPACAGSSPYADWE